MSAGGGLSAPPRPSSAPPGKETAPRASALVARLPAWAITAAAAIAYVIAAPPSPDLAAASYRASLFSSAGFTLWDNSWYGGHHLPAYSLLAPALGAWIGPQPLAAISMIFATALFARLIDGVFPVRATRIAAAWFAIGASVALLSSRVPFDLGLALGLGALVLVRRGHRWVGLALGVLTALASPVAGAFLALAFLTWALVGPASAPRAPSATDQHVWHARVWHARVWPALLTLAALVPILALAVAFPEGGTQPFAPSAFYPALAGVAAIGLLLEAEHRLLRVGAAVYALALIGAFALPTAVGGNADRLGALAAGPIAACALACASRWRRRALIVLAPALLYWQANAPVADFAAAAGDPSVNSSYYAPLVGELRALGVGYGARPARIEVVATADHWEARWLAGHVMIARGWERQLDTYRNGLFYEEATPLTAARYHAWLTQNAISYVALPDASLDYSAQVEARLLRGRRPHGVGAQAPSYLHEVWHSRHWRLFAVLGAAPLAQAPAQLASATHDSFTLSAPRAGSFTVRLRFTPYWALASGHGCVSAGREGWTQVQARGAGRLHVVIDFSLARVLDHGPRCR
ncbi:MAG TPA: hypothetical protein VED41_09310 [Solirubrobacteraceae bacterium]|nr:hypothetical protein [Solirubrobacteraceae bacterium]